MASEMIVTRHYEAKNISVKNGHCYLPHLVAATAWKAATYRQLFGRTVIPLALILFAALLGTTVMPNSVNATELKVLKHFIIEKGSVPEPHSITPLGKDAYVIAGEISGTKQAWAAAINTEGGDSLATKDRLRG